MGLYQMASGSMVVALLVGTVTYAQSNSSNDLVETTPARLNEVFRLHASTVQTLDLDRVGARVGSAVVSLDGAERTLEWRPHSVRSSSYRMLVQNDNGGFDEVTPPAERTIRGAVREVPGSVVVGAVLDEGLSVFVWLPGQGGYGVEPLGQRSAELSDHLHVVYHTDNLIEGHGECGVSSGSFLGGFGTIPCDPSNAIYSNLDLRMVLAAGTDLEFVQSFGLNPNVVEAGDEEAAATRIETIMASVNFLYEQLEIEIVLGTIVVSLESYSGEIGNVLCGFREDWETMHSDVERDIAQFFTGNLFTDFNGLATIGSICDPIGGMACDSGSYSIVEGLGFAACSRLSAHEIGHNLGAVHTECCTESEGAGCTSLHPWIMNSPTGCSFGNSNVRYFFNRWYATHHISSFLDTVDCISDCCLPGDGCVQSTETWCSLEGGTFDTCSCN